MSEERVEPAPLSVALLYKLLKAQRETLKVLKSQIPKGEFRPITLQISNTPTVLEPKSIPEMPWIKFTIFNDGPDPVYLEVNEEFLQQTTPLNIDESLAVDMITPQIEKVRLFCAVGQTASVRLFTKK